MGQLNHTYGYLQPIIIIYCLKIIHFLRSHLHTSMSIANMRIHKYLAFSGVHLCIFHQALPRCTTGSSWPSLTSA